MKIVWGTGFWVALLVATVGVVQVWRWVRSLGSVVEPYPWAMERWGWCVVFALDLAAICAVLYFTAPVVTS